MTVYGLEPPQRRLYETVRPAGDLVDQLRRLQDVGRGSNGDDIEQVRAALFRDAGLQATR